MLLYLIKRDNIDIYDIPIAKITKDYLGYLDLMEELQIDLAGEFFVMAATLMRIKVQMLLRRDDEIEDPREELVRNLVEYRKMVEAAQLDERDGESPSQGVHQIGPAERKGAPGGAGARAQSLRDHAGVPRHHVAVRNADESRRSNRRNSRLRTRSRSWSPSSPRIRRSCSASSSRESSSRLEMVVTFMAILELMKRAVIRCVQEGAFGEIWIYRRDDPPQAEEPDAGAGLQGKEPDPAEIETGEAAEGTGIEPDGATNG